MRHHAKWTAALGVAAVLALCGCGGTAEPRSVADAEYEGQPKGDFSAPVDVIDGQPVADWLDEGETFAVVTWGSSSCPWVADSMRAQGGSTVHIGFANPNLDRPCTADFAAQTHEFTLPEGIETRPVTLRLTFEGQDGVTRLTLD